MAKAFPALSLASAVAVAILFNISGAGLLARLLVYVFLAGLLTSGIAAALSSRLGALEKLQRVCTVVFGAYVLTAAFVALWIMAVQPPFGSL